MLIALQITKRNSNGRTNKDDVKHVLCLLDEATKTLDKDYEVRRRKVEGLRFT